MGGAMLCFAGAIHGAFTSGQRRRIVSIHGETGKRIGLGTTMKAKRDRDGARTSVNGNREKVAGIDGNRTHRRQVSLPPDGFEGRGRHQPVTYSQVVFSNHLILYHGIWNPSGRGGK